MFWKPVAAGLCVVGLAVGCTSTSRRATPAPSAGSQPAPPPTFPTTTRPPTTTPPATTPPTTTPPLATPGRLALLAPPAIAGEGVWQPAGERLRGGYPIYTTSLQAGAGLPASGIAWIDSAAVRLALYAGSGEPYGRWPQQSLVTGAQQPRLLAAFNSGFKIYNYRTGWYDQGQAAMPLQPGAASLVIFRNGRATVGEWGRDVSLTPQVVSVRQNLSLLVDGGVATVAAQSPYSWGAVLGGGYVAWRSGVGVTALGDLVYAAGPELTPAELARLLVAAHVVRAMELDINPEWVSFATFTHTGLIGSPVAGGQNLLSAMNYYPDHYLQGYSRDFFAVFAR